MKYVYSFGPDLAEEALDHPKELLGGKGAGLREMTRLGIPVPPGFTLTTEVCRYHYDHGRTFPESLEAQVREAVARVESAVGARFGDADNPLLFSVRSGARVSMPGMMDTVLNLGLNDATVEGIARKSGSARFAYDSYRRFVQMYGDVVLGMKPESKTEHDPFEEILERKKSARGARLDTDLTAEDLKALVAEFKAEIRKRKGIDLPEDPYGQLWGAIGAVFGSWENPRAITYRKLNGIPGDWGTAVTVQAMVFGNLGDDCATGVAFTRDPSTGERRFFGEYLRNAQGEDVVAGTRTPQPVAKKPGALFDSSTTLEAEMPVAYAELVTVYQKLEAHFRDMQDIEFTIQRGKLWLLQTRTGKRTARAMVRIAVEMVKEGLISRDEAILRLDAKKLDELLHPMLDPKAPRKVIARGLPASPGAAVGKVVFHADEAEEMKAKGEKVILVRLETSPEDIHGMHAAQGILTARGGMTCVAGETRVLTDRGLLRAEEAFARIEEGERLRILSFDARAMRSVWRDVIAAGRRPAQVVSVSVSQTGRVDENVLRLTADHKMYALDQRKLVKVPLADLLAREDFVTVLSHLPGLLQSATTPALAYVAGAVLSDGYINLRETKGSVTFVQKPTPEKADFILAVERCFEQAFSTPFSYVRERETVAVLKGRTIREQVEDRICFRREPAQRLAEIRGDLVGWVLTLDRTALLHFLAGYIDGDGTYAEESSAVRLQISVSAAKPGMIEGVVMACLRLGIVPQVTSNRDNWTIQIAEQVEDIVAYTHRVRPEIPARGYASRCLAVRGLFSDILEHVNFMGRVREGLKRNIMFGADKIERDLLPLCPPGAYHELKSVLDAPLRSFRAKQVGGAEPATVYNFEVDATDEIDKCFVVFTSRFTPVLVSNSHAAVVARGMGKCCVAGCSDVHIDYGRGEMWVNTPSGKVSVRKGDVLSLDGGKGEVILGAVPFTAPALDEDYRTVMAWVDESRRLGVRTNADTPVDAATARSYGAEGIGLCRTEHMFFDEAKILAVREMILADTEVERRAALAKILPMQREDFIGIFKAMDGLPVTIRLLDPPLHEFLPTEDAQIDEVAQGLGVTADAVRARVVALHEANPMLGHRGCRLGVTHPEIYETQVRAIIEAACACRREGVNVRPEIMIPLVGAASELRVLRALTEETARDVIAKEAVDVAYTIGTMIELPRACVAAGKIAEHADFFSFGTNDLTQTALGLSRDDAGKFLGVYVERGIYPKDPFVALDQEGVGELIHMAIERGRTTKPGLKVGICGEHGGEPSSVAFCHDAGLDYVSCSPFRVPIARLAAAQAALRSRSRA
jgi:phosphoenolpyruvate synthase/pyruvate phosphate dikinase